MSIFLKKKRYYQTEVSEAICQHFDNNSELDVDKYNYFDYENDSEDCEKNKCLVKMFCGTGKSLIMRTCPINLNKKLVVFVFPSLQLIEQFVSDYIFDTDLKKYKSKCLRICSDDDEHSTTHLPTICKFLKLKSNKLICVTYQSFSTLISCLNSCNIKMDVCHFDEAHHSVGEVYQNLIFNNNQLCDKQIFYTATPKNDNGIVMYDPDYAISDCGDLIYDYNYFRGMTEGYLNSFDINVDFFSENNNNSIYESIIRAALSTNNNRVLCFHSNVNTDSDTSVINFADHDAFMIAFNMVNSTEFDGILKYRRIHLIPFHAAIPIKCSSCKSDNYSVSSDRCCRFNMLNDFDRTPDDELFIICSCKTIGEGVDTKNANLVCFVDPKSSAIEILQNIGRIVRKQFGIEKPKSTILLPCWVDKEKYMNICDDPVKRDAMIREDLNK